MKRISDLLRTNVALAALCIISIGVLVIVFRGTEQSSNALPYQKIPALAQQSYPEALFPSADLPATSTFESFVYGPGKELSVSGTCADTYKVLMIFPSDVDYRKSPLFAKYNGATPCVMGQKYSDTIKLNPLNLQPGIVYYYLRASEGDTGSWYSPY